MNNSTESKNYWQHFLNSLPPDSLYHDKTYVAEPFGDNPDLANRLGMLVVDGTKTATCSAVVAWETEGNPIPTAGDVWIVLDGDGHPMCIVETTEVTIRAYNEVDADFAYAEGEGDRSLESWREGHRNYFTRTLPAIGHEFTENLPLVCERFTVIYK